MATAGPTIFDDVRAAAEWVASQARFVRIDDRRLEDYAAGLPLDEIRNPVLDPEAHRLGRGAETVAFFMILDAINFGSGWFPVLRKRPGCSGYFTVARSLSDWFRKDGVPDPAALAGIRAGTCAERFGQDPANREVMELMALFARALNDLGLMVIRDCGGRYEAMIERAGCLAGNLVRTLTQMPLYRDVAEYRGRAVPFYKRAQLTCADLWLAFGGEGYGRFDDVDSLTIFADNLVPHVLRVDRVLVYERGLLGRIDAGELIVPGSEEEVEIRATAVAAVERMVAHLSRLGRPASARRLDYWLWNRGGRPEFKAIPRHRARTPYY